MYQDGQVIVGPDHGYLPAGNWNTVANFGEPSEGSVTAVSDSGNATTPEISERVTETVTDEGTGVTEGGCRRYRGGRKADGYAELHARGLRHLYPR